MSAGKWVTSGWHTVAGVNIAVRGSAAASAMVAQNTFLDHKLDQTR